MDIKQTMFNDFELNGIDCIVLGDLLKLEVNNPYEIGSVIITRINYNNNLFLMVSCPFCSAI